MLHTHSRIWIHLVWATHNREPCLDTEKSKQLFDFMIDKGKQEGFPFEKLFIRPEDVHALIDLPTNKTLSAIMQVIKGSSSYWLNENLFRSHFSWQRGYGAYSVSASKLERVKTYIANQDIHHRKTTFTEEYNKWRKEYGVFED